jgi:hypothetical protein
MRNVGDCFAFADLAVLSSVAVWNYNGFPVTLHGDYSKPIGLAKAPIYYAPAIAVALERSTGPMPEFK